jgi:iron complex outermembrane receptor protein
MDYHRANTRADMIMYPANEAQMYMQTLPENILHNAGISFGKTFEPATGQKLLLNGRVDFFHQHAVSGFGAQQWEVFQMDVTGSTINLLKNLNLSYQHHKWKAVHVQYSLGYGERIPTANERYGYYLFNRQDQYDYIGNVKLKPEKSWQTELTLSRKMEKVQVNVNLFAHYIRHYIYTYRLEGMSQMTMGAYGLKTYKNIDYVLNTGGEAMLSAKILHNLHYMAALKYVYGQTHDGSPIALTPPLKGQQALRYTFKGYQIQAEYDAAARQGRVNSDYGDRITPSYHLFNLRLSGKYDIRETRIQWSAACENIFDIRYREHLDIGQIPRFGRNILLNLGWVF